MSLFAGSWKVQIWSPASRRSSRSSTLREFLQNFPVAHPQAHLQNRFHLDDVNQQTIADRLRISRATVSRCFTNHRAINPATRARVFEVAAQLGYRYLDPRSASRQKKASTTVGVLISYAGTFTENDRLESPGPELLDGISQLAQLRGVQLDMHYVHSSETTLDSPSYRRVMGLQRTVWRGALLMYAFPEPIVKALCAQFPCVSLLEQYARLEINCVDVDHYRGIAQVMDLLLAAGHRRIGFFSPVARPESYWTMHRFSAYLEKLLALGHEFRPEDVINVRPGAAVSADRAIAQLQAQTDAGVTAWVCSTDYAAYTVTAHLQKRGLRVPEDISVTGFDGIVPPEGLPPVTTVQAPFREIGLAGCRRLLDLVQTPFDPPQYTMLGGRLRPGQTVAPVARAGVAPSGEAASER